MPDPKRPALGTVGWIDLTVDDATGALDFYTHVCAWESAEFDMGGYNDFCVSAPGVDDPVAGICHNKGDNAGFPAQWIMYIVVPNADEAAQRAQQRGGEVVMGPKPVMDGRFALIKDPNGAHFGVMSWPGHG